MIIEDRMKYRKLGASDLNVSEISLGSWLTYGVGVKKEQAVACVNRIRTRDQFLRYGECLWPGRRGDGSR
ncbi:MAG TPA: hypothetical protein VHW69_01500 [Rhizomicrobium sp.]|nr:hypothetical protein [Rhizomicrobium sp.]